MLYLKQSIEKARENLNLGISCIKILEQDRDIFLPENFKDYEKEFPLFKIILGVPFEYFAEPEKSETIEKAIKYFEKAIKDFNPNEDSIYYGLANLGLAYAYYYKRIDEKKTAFEKSIKYFEKALKVFTEDKFEVYFAVITLNFGYTYFWYETKNKETNSKHIEMSISYLKKSLKIFEKHQIDCFIGINNINLAANYIYKQNGDHEENLKLSEHHALIAIELINKEKAPYYFARAIYNKLNNPLLSEENIVYDYLKLLKFFQENKYPYYFGNINEKLGLIYGYTLNGNHSENIEIAINYFNNSVNIYLKSNLLYQINFNYILLAELFITREKKNTSSENIETSFSYLNKAEIFFMSKSKIYPYETACINSAKGVAYILKSNNKKEKDIELAINYLNKAFEFFNKEKDLFQLGFVNLNLGLAYLNRIKGFEPENIEFAINYLNNALEIFTKEKIPFQLGIANLNLGFAHLAKFSENNDKNIKVAITYLKNSLEFFNKENFPIQFAMTNLNLGASYLKLEENTLDKNIEPTIKHLNQALEVFSINQDYQFYLAYLNLGKAYLCKASGNREHNLKLGIKYLEIALIFFTKENRPLEFAEIKFYFFVAYQSMFLDNLDNKEDNRKLAIKYLEESIEYTTLKHTKAFYYLNIASKDLYNDKMKYYHKIKEAINFIESTRISYFIPEHKEKFLEYSIELFSKMINVCLKLYDENIENIHKKEFYESEIFKYIEMSKTRTLIDNVNAERIIFDLDLVKDNKNKQLMTELEKINESLTKINSLEKNCSMQEILNTRDITLEKKLIENDRETLIKLKNEITRKLYDAPNIKNKLTYLNGEVITLEELRHLFRSGKIDSKTGIIQYYLSDDIYLLIFITKDDIKIKKWFFDNENDLLEIEEFSDLATFYYYTLDVLKKHFGNCLNLEIILKNLENNPSDKKYFELYLNTCNKFKCTGSTIEELTHNALDIIGKGLYKFLYKPVEENIKNLKLNRIMFVENNFLNNFSFNLLKSETMGKNEYIISKNKIEFFKVVSISLWKNLADNTNIPLKNAIGFGINNYTNYRSLKFVENELDSFKQAFKAKIYKNESITLDLLKKEIPNSNIVLLSGHGTYNGNIEESGYILSYKDKKGQRIEKILTLEEIFRKFPKCSKTSLVILSLCFGGTNNFKASGDIIGFIPTMFSLGVSSIVSNILPLDDKNSSEFFSSFYHNLKFYEKSKTGDKLSALLQTQLEWIEDRESLKHPYNWAFLEFYGNTKF